MLSAASGKEYVEELEAKMKEIGVGEVATVAGRYYAMDRDNRWDRVERAYKALVKGEGVEAASATEGIQASYDNEKTDEFVEPMVIMKDGAPTATVKDGDSIIFFNFRPRNDLQLCLCDQPVAGKGASQCDRIALCRIGSRVGEYRLEIGVKVDHAVFIRCQPGADALSDFIGAISLYGCIFIAADFPFYE